MDTDAINKTKLIRVTELNHGEMDKLRGKGESYNTVVSMLLRVYKEHKLKEGKR